MKTSLQSIEEIIVTIDPASQRRVRALCQSLAEYGSDDIVFQMMELFSIYAAVLSQCPANMRHELDRRLTEFEQVLLENHQHLQKHLIADFKRICREEALARSANQPEPARSSNTKHGLMMFFSGVLVSVLVFLFLLDSVSELKPWAVRVTPVSQRGFCERVTDLHLRQNVGLHLETHPRKDGQDIVVGLLPSNGVQILSVERMPEGKVLLRFYRHPDLLPPDETQSNVGYR